MPAARVPHKPSVRRMIELEPDERNRVLLSVLYGRQFPTSRSAPQGFLGEIPAIWVDERSLRHLEHFRICISIDSRLLSNQSNPPQGSRVPAPFGTGADSEAISIPTIRNFRRSMHQGDTSRFALHRALKIYPGAVFLIAYHSRVAVETSTGWHVRYVPGALAQALAEAGSVVARPSAGRIRTVVLARPASSCAIRTGEATPGVALGTRFWFRERLPESGAVVFSHHPRCFY